MRVCVCVCVILLTVRVKLCKSYSIGPEIILLGQHHALVVTNGMLATEVDEVGRVSTCGAYIRSVREYKRHKSINKCMLYFYTSLLPFQRSSVRNINSIYSFCNTV